MRYLQHEVHELDGYNQELRDILWNLFRVSRLKFTRKVPSKATLDWALTNVFEDLDFLSHYRAANRIKRWHHHLNIPLHHSQFWNLSNVMCSTVFDIHDSQKTNNDDNKNTRHAEWDFASKQKSDFLRLYLWRLEHTKKKECKTSLKGTPTSLDILLHFLVFEL